MLQRLKISMVGRKGCAFETNRQAGLVFRGNTENQDHLPKAMQVTLLLCVPNCKVIARSIQG
jgi:hypothetical protein